LFLAPPLGRGTDLATQSFRKLMMNGLMTTMSMDG
jgi:hypothetical protein